MTSGGDRKLLAAPAVRIGLAAVSAVVLIVGALVAPRATPTTIPASEERATPLLEAQVREVVRPFDGIADAAARLQLHGVAIERQSATPAFGGTDYLAPNTDAASPGAGVFVTDRYVVTSIPALGDRSNPRVITASGAAFETRAVAYDLASGLVLLETAAVGKPAPVAAVLPAVGTLVVAAAPHTRGPGAQPAFVTATSDTHVSIAGLGSITPPGVPLFTTDGAVFAIVVEPDWRVLPIQPARDRLLALAAAGAQVAAIGIGWEPRRGPLKGVADGIGLSITAVVPGGPADLAEIVEGDVVLSLAGIDLATADDLRRALQGAGIGTEVALRVWRRSRVQEVRVTPQSALDVALLARRSATVAARGVM